MEERAGMRIRTSQKNKKINQIWGITHLMHLQNIGIEEGIDTNEYIAEINGEVAMISPRPMMTIERLQAHHTLRYFQLPRQVYEFLDWGRKNGEESSKFRMVNELPSCEEHWESMGIKVPGPFGCSTENGLHFMCPEHATSYRPVECLFVEGNDEKGQRIHASVD